MRRWVGLATCGLSLALAVPRALAAQQIPGGPILEPQGGPGWLPTVGVRGGFDYRNSSPSVGALLRLPIPLPVLRPALTPGGDLVFQDGLTERQAMVDLTVDLFGIAVGGGPAWMNTIFGEDDSAPRETRQGWTALAGVRSAGRIGTSLEFRWLFVDDIKPRYIMLAVTFTPGAPRRRGGF